MTDREFLIGGDISALARLERQGAQYSDGGVPGDAIAIMRHHGCNCFRLRLFVDPDDTGVVVNDLAYTARLAKRVKDSGARLLLNFHYSDTWADPAHQSKPKAWAHLELEGLVDAVRRHTTDAILRLIDAGAAPDIVQVGNEITPGMLWPDGKLYDAGDPDEQWGKFAALLRAGATAVRAASPASRVALHIDKGASRGATKWFFDRIAEHGVDYDIIALSYYPWWHGSLDDVRDNLLHTARDFAKDILLVETAYPHVPTDFRGSEGWRDHMRWATTPDGQRDFLTELVQAVADTPDGRGLGVLWWYPESVLVPDMHIWYGGHNALFDAEGEVLPALRAFAAGIDALR
jgi:arabinogalactan endo-1,4-beta-galactosidase